MTTHTAAVTTVRLNAKVVAIIIASAIGAFLAGYAVYFFIASFRPEPTTSTREISTPARIRAVMYLSMDEVKATKNKPFTVDVMLDAKGTIINGADSVLTFDPKKVRIDNVATSPSPSFLYFPKVDKQKGRGIITAIKQTIDDTPTEVLRLASISVSPIAAGVTTIRFEHFPGKTNGSTAIRASDNVNILDTATGMNITIQ